MFKQRDTNFLSLENLPELTVTQGSNNRDTCYQYAVFDGRDSKLLVVKFYDKVIDLISREATHIVSSRIATIVGSQRTVDAFNYKLRHAKFTGLTRLEVSICLGAMQRYSPTQASVKTLWHQEMQAAMDSLSLLN